MKAKLKKRIIPLFLCLFFAIGMFTSMPAYAVSQGTDGDELQVLDASELEIQLGTDWAGVGFVLRTDAGVYPGPVYVGSDGVLRLEIGGSTQYILSCMQSDIQVPEPVLLQMQALAAADGKHGRRYPGIPYGVVCRRHYSIGRDSDRTVRPGQAQTH